MPIIAKAANISQLKCMGMVSLSVSSSNLHVSTNVDGFNFEIIFSQRFSRDFLHQTRLLDFEMANIDFEVT